MVDSAEVFQYRDCWGVVSVVLPDHRDDLDNATSGTLRHLRARPLTEGGYGCDDTPHNKMSTPASAS